jgi:hypothetical protein
MAEQIASTFNLFLKRHGLDRPRAALNEKAFRPPAEVDGQGGLFSRA